jgi:hypothetical protein
MPKANCEACVGVVQRLIFASDLLNIRMSQRRIAINAKMTYG